MYLKFKSYNFFQYMVTGRRPVKPCSAVLLKKHCTWLEINPGILIWYLASSRNTVTIVLDTPSSTFFVFYKFNYNTYVRAARARYHGCSEREFSSLGNRFSEGVRVLSKCYTAIRGALKIRNSERV